MHSQEKARYQARARILKALAHPARLFIVEELAKGPRCVCELQRRLRLDISTVSKHLSVLKSAGMVQDEKRGLKVHYTLRFPCVLHFFSCAEAVLKLAAKEQRRLLET